MTPVLLALLLACASPPEGGGASPRHLPFGHVGGAAGDSAAPADSGEPGDQGDDGPCAGWPEDWSRMEDRLLELVNEVRAQGYDCPEGHFPPAPALEDQSQLRCAARLHSQDMAERDYFSHTSLDGRDLVERVSEQGLSGYSALGENIAAGVSSPEAALQLWLSSHEGHCGNLMGSAYTHMGAGVAYSNRSTYGWYWTQDFARLR